MSTQTHYRCAVVGAGPAGIAAVGKLLDSGIQGKDIAWIDPTFTVGDFGVKWSSVSSNTTVKLFTDFLYASLAFEYAKCTEPFTLNQLDPTQTCELHYMGDALKWVTQVLCKKVVVVKDKVHQITMQAGSWCLIGEHKTVLAEQVILAIGSDPKSLTYQGVTEIPLNIALDKTQIANHCDSNDVVAVFGSSHSAIIILQHLLAAKVKKVINFYRAPLCYAVATPEGYLFDDTGLKGNTAKWAKAHLHGQLPKNLERIYADNANVERHLVDCNKAVYAIGFQRRHLPAFDDFPHIEYNPYNGIIAPGLFGLGIAFPEAKIDKYGMVEYRVGLWKFMDYLNRILPLWLSYR